MFKNINIMDIINQHIIPELQDPNINDRPIVRADAIKFVAIFRNQLPLDTMAGVLPLVATHLRAEAVVLQSYAAYTVERFLTVKDPDANGKPVVRFNRQALAPFLNPLFEGLFGILTAGGEHFENEHVMKSIMRILALAKEDIVQHTPLILQSLNGALSKVCANPRNPQFNHFLFESERRPAPFPAAASKFWLIK